MYIKTIPTLNWSKSIMIMDLILEAEKMIT